MHYFVKHKLPVLIDKNILTNNKSFKNKKLLELFILNVFINCNKLRFFCLYKKSKASIFRPSNDICFLKNGSYLMSKLESIIFMICVDFKTLKKEENFEMLYIKKIVDSVIKKATFKKKLYLKLSFDRMYEDAYNIHKFNMYIKHKSCVTKEYFDAPYIENTFIDRFKIQICSNYFLKYFLKCDIVSYEWHI